MGGKAAVISFHSLEDRRVKVAFRVREVWEADTRKPIQATEEEERANPRSRSAKPRSARFKGNIDRKDAEDKGTRRQGDKGTKSG